MRKKIIIALIVTAAIAAIAVYFAGARQNQNASAGNIEEPSGSVEYIAKPNQDENQSQEVIKNQENAGTAGDRKLTEQESDELMSEMLNSLSDLEETVDSLDDVSDSDLQIPES